MPETDFFLQQKVYDMILYAYPALEQMPKSQKFSLAQDIKRCMDKIMRLVITANKKYIKKTTLQDLDVEVAALKVYIRIAYDLRYLPPKKYEYWSGMLAEIGKMVGGWRRSEGLQSKKDENGQPEYICSECGAAIPKKAEVYSTKNFGRALCYSCQKKAKEKQ